MAAESAHQKRRKYPRTTGVTRKTVCSMTPCLGKAGHKIRIALDLIIDGQELR